MPKKRPSSRARRIRSKRNLAAITAITGTTLLGLTTLIGASAAVAVFVNPYLGGMVFGVGIVAVAWATSALVHQRNRRPAPLPGRSRTLDCREARWARRAPATGIPHPPTEAQRRVRPCPGTHRT